MGKKKSCQEVIVPRPLDATETRLYGWVEKAVLTQQSVVESDALPEFRRSYPLMEDPGAEGDYVLEAAGPSDRVPFRADEDGPHFLWGRRLFDSYEESIQEFKWHYFKVLAAPEKRAFWLDHENKPFPWVYWNPEVKDFVVYNLEPLEMAAFKFLVSLPSGLPKRSKFTCRFILDGSDAEVGKFLDDLLDVKMKRTRLDDLMAKMADPTRMGPRPVLPTSGPSATATAAAAATVAGTSTLAVAGSLCVESSSQAPQAPTASDAKKAKKQPSKREPARVVDLEEELKENPAADLQSKRKRKKSLNLMRPLRRLSGMTPRRSMRLIPLRLLFRRILTTGRHSMRA
ncbi:hypothetical protein PIB30_055638 [Stylosanthes scabra]|uniref:Uncharacterized protein n=1 Tax=Stylosanthes scabra TaxID=79078 RepID=A0ABU6SIZ5_9FABA|nr:hypothetical protein [Stylosanthes scabra]